MVRPARGLLATTARSGSSSPAPRPSPSPAAVAYGTTVGFGENQVGTGVRRRPADLLQPDPQAARRAADDAVRQVHGLAPSAPTAASWPPRPTTGRSRCRSSTCRRYQLIWRGGTAAGVNLRLSDNTVGQEGPVVLAGRQVPLHAQRDRHHPVPGQRRRHARRPAPRSRSRPSSGQQALTAGMAFSPDGSTLYAAVNGQNTVVAIDPATGAIKQTWNVGIAPRQLTFVGNKLYVSNEGGRQAQRRRGHHRTPTAPQVPGRPVPRHLDDRHAQRHRHRRRRRAPVGQIEVGLHPTAMYAEGDVLYVANTNDDTVSVVDTDQRQGRPDDRDPAVARRRRSATSPTRHHGAATAACWSASAARTRSPSTSSARARSTRSATSGWSRPTTTRRTSFAGRRPDRRRQPPRHRRPRPEAHVQPGLRHHAGDRSRHARHHRLADPLHAARATARSARPTPPTVFAQNGWGDADTDVKHANGNRTARPVPVPERIGDPSTIKHVFLLVKENRTYDQVYGDMPEGNGDADPGAVRRAGDARTSTRWPASSASTTTPTTSAPTPPRATTG